jgi:hypothetical protein
MPAAAQEAAVGRVVHKVLVGVGETIETPQGGDGGDP